MPRRIAKPIWRCNRTEARAQLFARPADNAYRRRGRLSNFDAFVDWADAVGRDPARRKRVALGLVGAGFALFLLFHRSI